MSLGTREIKRRIKSVQNTKKITKAMELVAAAKMRRAMTNVLATRDYANVAWATVLHLAAQAESGRHPLLEKRDSIKNVAVIVISSNRGLCGGFNTNIVQKVVDSIAKHEGLLEKTEIITLGSRGRDLLMGKYPLTADFIKQDVTVSAAETSGIAHLVISEYEKKRYDKVMVAYTDYVSAIKQIPRVKQLLPIEPEPDEYLGVVGSSAGIETTKDFIHGKQEKYQMRGEHLLEYVFEPSPDEVLKQMVPRLIEMQIYQAVLESDASEHSARMLAMRNASDAATDMIGNLTLIYNQARQAAITQEIAEISSGKAALE